MSNQEETRAIVETSRTYSLHAEGVWVGLDYCEPVTALRFDPPLQEGAEVVLDVNGEVVPLDRLFSLPGAIEARSTASRILCAMNPELEGKIVDTPALDKFSIRVTGAGGILPHNQRVIAEGLNVRVTRGEEHVDMFHYHGQP